MACHVAIMRQPYLGLILQGRKTMESRLTLTRRPPWGVVKPGEVIHFKQSSGPYRCQAVAGQVHHFDQLTPGDIQTLRERFNDRVLGDDAYWQSKSMARYATFIELREVMPVTTGPVIPKSHGVAWFVVSDV